jgi:hypothetical protein
MVRFSSDRTITRVRPDDEEGRAVSSLETGLPNFADLRWCVEHVQKGRSGQLTGVRARVSGVVHKYFRYSQSSVSRSCESSRILSFSA